MKRILSPLYLLTVGLLMISATGALAAAPDMEKIKAESTNPESQYYYPRMFERFLTPDTTMTDEDYRYFYYGTLYAEDYNPYRQSPYEKEVKALEPVYLKREHLTGTERRRIQELAVKCLQDNPLDLRQLMYLVYVYQSNRKYNLAKIWKHKLDKLLKTIASSGSGVDSEHARVIVYPRHEFDFFNLSGHSVSSQEFVEPYYEKVTVQVGTKAAPRTADSYFNLRYLLEQYYAKHPSELQAEPAGATEAPTGTAAGTPAGQATETEY